LEKLLDFARVFVDRCHHASEEKYLFPKLQKKDLARFGPPVRVMLHEHEGGRQLLQALAGALAQAKGGDQAAAVSASLTEALLAYGAHLRSHIDKESNVLFHMAEQALTVAEQQNLLEAFEKHEHEVVGPGVHEKYKKLAQELAEEKA
jgi:hemerythrin-like domain-containing protein